MTRSPFLVLASLLAFTSATEPTLFARSLVITPEQLQQQIQGQYEMEWTSQDISVKFIYHDNTTQMIITAPTHTLAAFDEKLVSKFIQNSSHSATQLIYPAANGQRMTSNDIPTKPSFKSRCVNKLIQFIFWIQKLLNISPYSSTLATPLAIKNAHPKQITIEQAATLIHDKRVLIYTGAGISAGVVPTMGQLMEQFKFAVKQDMVSKNLLGQLLADPEFYTAIMSQFYNACLHGAPTTAHHAISELIQQYECELATENLDILHQKTGIVPIKRSDFWQIKRKELKQIDYIIAIGLASDESGLLAWYKQNNPQGLIIAINVSNPDYLSDTDLLLLADAQEALPLLKSSLAAISHRSVHTTP